MASKTFGDAAFALTGTASSGLTVSYTSSNTSVATVSGSTVTIVGAGSTNITASQAGNTSYNAASNVIQAMVVGKATLTATADNKAKSYGDANPAFTITYSGFKNSETSAVLTVEPTGSSIATATTNVGTVDINVAGGLDDNYDFSYVKGTLTIAKATLTATADNKAKSYGDANPAFTITYSGFKNSETTAVLTVEPTGSSIATATTNVGTVDIDVAGGLDDNYDFSYVKGTLTIAKATLTATADNKAKSYGDANPAFTITYSGFKNSETSAVLTVEPTGSSIATATTNVGTVDINVAGGLDNNYDFSYVKGTLTIAKATLTATADNKAKSYGEENPAFTITYSGFKNSETSAVLTVEPSAYSIATATTNVGTVDIDVAGGLDDNYDFSYVKGTLTIAKAILTATADNKAKSYGDANSAFTITYSGFKNSETTAGLTVEPSAYSIATATTNVGTVDIDVAGGLDDNYDFSYVKGTLTIAKATLTATADNKAKSYGDANPAFTITYSGFKNSETTAVLTVEPTGSSIATATTNVGTVDIDVAGGLDDNYDFSYVKGTLSIVPTFTAPAGLCINAAVQSGLGGGAPTGGVYSGAGVTDDGNGMTYSLNPQSAGVGTHTITYTNGSIATNDLEIFALPAVNFTAPADMELNSGVKTGLNGGSPTGAVSNNSWVLNGVTMADGAIVTGFFKYALGATSISNPIDWSIGISGGNIGTFPAIILTPANSNSTFSNSTIAIFTLNTGVNPRQIRFNTGNSWPTTGGTTISLDTSNLAGNVECFSCNPYRAIHGGTVTGGISSTGVYSGTGVTDDGNGTTYSFNPLTAGVGTHTITYTFQSSDGCSNTATDEVKVMDLIVPTITFNNLNKTYGEANFNLASTSNSGGAIAYSIISGGIGTAALSGTNNKTVTLGTAGSVTIRATQEANGIYTGGTKDITLTIAKATLTAIATDKTKNVWSSRSNLNLFYNWVCKW